GLQADRRWFPARRDRNHQRQDAHFPRAGISRHGLHAGGDRHAGSSVAGGGQVTIPLYGQIINLLAALLLLLSFAMLVQRRILSLINLFMAQGAVLCASTTVVAFATGQHHLYGSAAITLILKVL